MTPLITTLTDAQLRRMEEVRDEWLTIGLSTEPADRAAAEDGVCAAYRAAGLEPPRFIIWLGSPLAGVWGQAIAPIAIRELDRVWDRVWGQVWDQVGDQVGGQVWGQVRGQVRGQVGDQVRGQVWDRVGDRVGDQVRGQVRDPVEDQVRDRVRGQVGEQVWDRVWDRVWGQVWGQVGDLVEDHVWGQVRGQVGDQVRDQVRDQVEDQVGGRVGDRIRGQVMGQVGDRIRGQVGDRVGDRVEDHVWGQVRGQVGDRVGGQVWDQIRDQVMGQVGDQVRGRVGDQVWDRVGDRVGGQVGDRVWSQVWDQVRDQVRGQVRGQVWDQVRAWTRALNWGQHDAGWLSFYAAMEDLGVTNLDLVHGQQQVARAAGWWWSYRHFAVLTERPNILRRDNQGRLHCETGPAIAYPDGWAIWAWHGTRVPADLIEKGWDTTRILREPNAETRRCAIERTGWDRFVAEAGLTQVGDTRPDPGNPGHQLALYDVPERIYDEHVRVLIAVNGTPERDGTRRTFGLTVPADIGDPVAAAAWTYGLPRDLYLTAERRT